eukprot:gene17784-biopygen22855
MARRAEHVPLPFDARASIVAAAPVARAAWGCENHELAKARAQSFRAKVTRAVWGRHHRKRCPEVVHTLLVPGHRTDPYQVAIFTRVMSLSRRLVRSPRLLERLRKVWGSAPDATADGPVGRIRGALETLEWTWPAPEKLRTRSGEEIDLREPHDGRLAHELREALRHSLWKQAAQRRPKDMGGLERGLDRAATGRLLRARDLSALDKGYLRVILAGGQWTHDRLHRCNVVEAKTCPFCTTGEIEDQQHLHWRCPAWDHVRKQHPAAMGLRREGWPTCLLCCGLMPADMTGPLDAACEAAFKRDRRAPELGDAPPPPPGPAPEGRQEHEASVETIVQGHVVVWTDGASTNNQHRPLRRAGYGAFWGTRHSANASEALPGVRPDQQGNNRAGRMAGGAVEIRTDSQYVYDGDRWHRHRWRANDWRRKRGSTAAIDHADLWKELDALCAAREGGPGAPRLTKVKGHATLEDLAQGRVAAIDRWGNDRADYLATSGAARHAATPEEVKQFFWRQWAAEKVQRMYPAIARERERMRPRERGTEDDDTSGPPPDQQAADDGASSCSDV